MNIFVSDKNPDIAAKNLDDKRLIKMCLETAQLLATAISLSGGQATYKTTHKNHPSAIFVRLNRANFEWTFKHFLALLNEYSLRFNKTHACAKLIDEFVRNAYLIPEGNLTSFPNCTTFKQESNIIKAYQDYLCTKWKNDKRPPAWTNAEKPSFYVD